MDAWIRQKGYPLITVTHEHSTVKQERYLLKAPEPDDASSSDVSPDGYKWFVPVTFVTNLSNRQNTYWLNMSNGEFTLPAEVEWLKVNVNQTGFYRVTYDIALWKKLIDVLHSNHKIFSPADRGNLVDDAISFTRVPLNIRSAVYNAGVKYGGKEEWEFCLKKYQETQDSSEKYLLLIALASTQETSRLSLYLNYCLDEEKIRPQDALIAIVYAARNLTGPSVTWPFVRSNWNLLLQMYGTEYMGYIIDETITYFTTQEDYNEVKAFLEEANAGAVIDSLNQSLETMKINIQWRQNLETFVFEWLQENVNKNFNVSYNSNEIFST